MQKLYYIGTLGLLLFEVLRVYLIMPMPGSQEMDSIGLAYFLHQWRWIFRAGFGIMILLGMRKAMLGRSWLALLAMAALVAVAWLFNFQMTAERMFRQPGQLVFADSAANKIPLEKLVLGLDLGGESRAYPIQLIAYHHQVVDTVAGQPVMVTYCSVCRSGRIFEPAVGGKPESFRLVGMDHYNAMFEDSGTGSWWRQVTGEAVAGPLSGSSLPEVKSEQTTLKQWLLEHPASLVMQPDSAFSEEYDELDNYDTGIGRGPLTGTDTLSGKDKSWVVGLERDGHREMVDWNRLKEERLVNLDLGGWPVAVVLASDDMSFYAFERPGPGSFEVVNDTVYGAGNRYTLWGASLADSLPALPKVRAYQEFQHSWQTFHPDPRYLIE